MPAPYGGLLGHDKGVPARFGRALAGYEGGMRNTWMLLAVPGTCVLLAGVLFLSAWMEQQMLSPRMLIRGAARARRGTPEFAEAYVARQFERLLREASGTAEGARRQAATPLRRSA